MCWYRYRLLFTGQKTTKTWPSFMLDLPLFEEFAIRQKWYTNWNFTDVTRTTSAAVRTKRKKINQTETQINNMNRKVYWGLWWISRTTPVNEHHLNDTRWMLQIATNSMKNNVIMNTNIILTFFNKLASFIGYWNKNFTSVYRKLRFKIRWWISHHFCQLPHRRIKCFSFVCLNESYQNTKTPKQQWCFP